MYIKCTLSLIIQSIKLFKEIDRFACRIIASSHWCVQLGDHLHKIFVPIQYFFFLGSVAIYYYHAENRYSHNILADKNVRAC